MKLNTTVYYDEFLRYYQLAKTQQFECNIGDIPHIESSVDDDLMKHVPLYDVVERKYAGFSNILNDAFYGFDEAHPHAKSIKSSNVTNNRSFMLNNFTQREEFGLVEWLYLCILHRVTGSGIDYSQKESGYHNSLILHLCGAKSVGEMVEIVNTHRHPFYTSVGYQYPAFPKPDKNKYKRGGDYYLTEYAPRLAMDLAIFLEKNKENGKKLNFREIGSFMLDWNVDNKLRRYFFQYAAVVADIGDLFPEFVNLDSHFYYGTNAVECISYLAKKPKSVKRDVFLDMVMDKIYTDTGAFPYNAEDVCCDFIRWVENYVKPGVDYNGFNYDKIWSSCNIKNHPFGRQENMLTLGLVETFNGMKNHPSDDTVIKTANISVEEYKTKCSKLHLEVTL